MPALYDDIETEAPLAVFKERDQSFASRCRAHKHIESEEVTLPIFSVPGASLNVRGGNLNGRLLDGSTHSQHSISDRAELMDLLKRGPSPTWASVRKNDINLPEREVYKHEDLRQGVNSVTLLPAAEVIEATTSQLNNPLDQLGAGLEIERPRSALHSGNFTDGSNLENWGTTQHNVKHTGAMDNRPPWLPRPDPHGEVHNEQAARGNHHTASFRSLKPLLSSSCTSSFVFKSPTSPLVQSEINEDSETLPRAKTLDMAHSATRAHRRFSLQAQPRLPPQSSYFLGNEPSTVLHREGTLAYQAQQSQPPVHFGSTTSATSPQTPLARSRRLSFTSDASPILHASMVGSYEESILRGRMSTTPSKPLDFVAQIGVLGLGNCKSALRCPPHVVVPFPAVFYSYETTSHSRSMSAENEPSPYVGQIDLENRLASLDETRGARRRHIDLLERRSGPDIDTAISPVGENSITQDRRQIAKQGRRSTGSRAPPGGSYRIPEKGQIQIIIKNPNKTAVKLFLVPYDLTGMEPGTKTFVRQRSYAVGPLFESKSPLHSTAPLNRSNERAALRYLIHLQICCPSRGRFYLYKSIRLVFANRVPDGKEKLRVEVSLPEPRFSVYKITRDMSSNTGPNLAADKAFRRRSAGMTLGSGAQGQGIASRSSLYPPYDRTSSFHDLSSDQNSRFPSSDRLHIGGMTDVTANRDTPLSWQPDLQPESNDLIQPHALLPKGVQQGLLTLKLKGLGVNIPAHMKGTDQA